MNRNDRNSAIAALVILVLFFSFAYYLPVIMIAAGNISTVLAVLVVAAFMLGLFAIFWLRARSQRDRDD
ncbi:MAG: hypothetical protein WA973_10735 [Mesorhizobium sp.]|jgi:hypothetical protein|uniref:LPXTG cell wall anchor domain-containing protein n=1 Tax=Aquamicrobium soli TaxID=1811518 RepID=A0ABV7KD54_9HYPH